MCRYLPCRFPFRFSNPRPSRPRWRRQGGEPEPMHTECRNAVEDGADGCFLLREEWGFPVILSERSEEQTSELQSLMRISFAVFCLKQKTTELTTHNLR